MRALQADRIAARQRARDSAARARRTAEEREAQLQTRRDAYARRTAGEREAELQMRRDAVQPEEEITVINLINAAPFTCRYENKIIIGISRP